MKKRIPYLFSDLGEKYVQVRKNGHFKCLTPELIRKHPWLKEAEFYPME